MKNLVHMMLTICSRVSAVKKTRPNSSHNLHYYKIISDLSKRFMNHTVFFLNLLCSL